MRLRLTHLVGELPAVSTRSAEEKIELEFANIAGTEAWVRERQIEMKWNVDRGRNVDPNKARKAKKAGMSLLVHSFSTFLCQFLLVISQAI